MSNESALAENIGRAVLAAIQTFSTATATASGPPQATSAPTTYNNPPGPATPTTSTGTSYRSVPFPSVLQRPATHSRFVRKNKACKHYTRDVVCLLFSSASTFRIPRGDSRANLARDGLIGKISFTSDWSEAQLKEEITAIFRRTFALSMGQSFPFEYLSTVKGCKRLMKPNVSSSFLWGGKEVASISSATCLYIMALIRKPVQEEPEELSDSDFESPVGWRRRVHTVSPSTSESELISQGSENDRLQESPSHQRMRSTVPSSLRESEGRCQETESSTQESESQGQAGDPRQVFPYNVAEFVPVYLEEDEALEEAIQRSLLEECDGPAVNTLKSSEMLSKEEIAGLLQAHSERVMTLGTRQVYISRANVWTTALRVFKRPSFAESCDKLYVTFASDEHDAVEDAADLGGPRREFFRLLVKAIFQDSGAFEGTPNGCTPRLNMLHLQNGVYRTIGRMMSTIIVQGGEPPAFLSPSVVDYIVSGDILQAHVTPDDIGDPDLRENLNKVQHATMQDDLDKAFYTILFCRRGALFDQLIDGLSHYGFLALLRENPSLRVLLDIPGEDKGQEADFVAGILKPSYSVLGSNRRAKEELMVVKFREFLQCVENKELRDTYGDRTLTNDEEAFLKTLSPGHILAFATGSSKVPAIGFHPTPKLIFIHDEKKHLPIAHTCANELHLFVNTTTMADDDEFNYCFLVALMNGSLFSTI
ncbi:hypothetical protein PFLUV_G00278370 [Perca fluviatilis]|uniref:HECT-type E3 ubiquitin transferase n=1 Tax=Perca fluviatilis TaxID=8168 RepID=A0A6A5E5Y6_PERFL|nr:hypothetical protein PFLUV_G00278370 [Perca fluviatilis]